MSKRIRLDLLLHSNSTFRDIHMVQFITRPFECRKPKSLDFKRLVIRSTICSFFRFNSLSSLSFTRTELTLLTPWSSPIRWWKIGSVWRICFSRNQVQNTFHSTLDFQPFYTTQIRLLHRKKSPKKLYTVGILNPDLFGFRMVESRPVLEWSGFD